MCVPPTSTFPGHHLTCVRIMCALVRMKPKVSRKATKKRKCGSRPVSTIPSWYALAMLPTRSTGGTLAIAAKEFRVRLRSSCRCLCRRRPYTSHAPLLR